MDDPLFEALLYIILIHRNRKRCRRPLGGKGAPAGDARLVQAVRPALRDDEWQRGRPAFRQGRQLCSQPAVPPGRRQQPLQRRPVPQRLRREEVPQRGAPRGGGRGAALPQERGRSQAPVPPVSVCVSKKKTNRCGCVCVCVK